MTENSILKPIGSKNSQRIPTGENEKRKRK
jgi:hypothetical protein